MTLICLQEKCDQIKEENRTLKVKLETIEDPAEVVSRIPMKVFIYSGVHLGIVMSKIHQLFCIY